MNIDRKRIREIFMEVMELSEAQRDAALDRACGTDAAIRDEVNRLIDADEQAQGDRFMTGPTASADAFKIAPLSERAGSVIANYKLLQLIGEGGFGTVFLAEQREPVRRKVAFKIIKLGMDTKSVVARFEQERQALALMDHPHIARVIDAGATDSGRPYFVMEYVKGDPITTFADAHKLSVRQRLDLFTQVCQAVQHAHTKGIIHRDIKPSNILVSMTDGRPFAKVIDFGIAKATGARLTDKTLFTEHRQLIGTPEYMSPEQAEGSPDIDTRTDVYGLGVLLYELLTGLTPFDAKRLRSAAFAEMQRIIKEEEPPAPSLRLTRDLNTLASTAAARQIEPARLGTLIRGELDWIVMKSLDKDRTRRYETPNALALDIQRHLQGEPVEAAPPSAGYRLRKFVRKHRGPVMAGSVAAIAILLGVIGAAWGYFVANKHLQAAKSAFGSVVLEMLNDSGMSPSEASGMGNGIEAAFIAQYGGDGYEWYIDWGNSSDPKKGTLMIQSPSTGEPLSEAMVYSLMADISIKSIKGARAARDELKAANAELVHQNTLARESLGRLVANDQTSGGGPVWMIADDQEFVDPASGQSHFAAPVLTEANTDSEGRLFYLHRRMIGDNETMVPKYFSEGEMITRLAARAEELGAQLQQGMKKLEATNAELQKQLKRAELAEADAQYKGLVLSGGMGGPAWTDMKDAPTIIDHVLHAREKWLPPGHIEIVQALWSQADLLEYVDASMAAAKYEQAAASLETAQGIPDGELLGGYATRAAHYFEELDLVSTKRWLDRVAANFDNVHEREGARAILDAVAQIENYFGWDVAVWSDVSPHGYAALRSELDSLKDAQLLEVAALCGNEPTKVRDLAQERLLDHPDDFCAATALASALSQIGQPEEAMHVALGAIASRENAHLTPNPANQAIIAMSLHALGRNDEARLELDRLRDMVRQDSFSKSHRAARWLDWAETVIDPKATPEQQFAEETKQRRLTAADLLFLKCTTEGVKIDEAIEGLEKVMSERAELLGRNNLSVAEALFELGRIETVHRSLTEGIKDIDEAINIRNNILEAPDEITVRWETCLLQATIWQVDTDGVKAVMRRIGQILPGAYERKKGPLPIYSADDFPALVGDWSIASVQELARQYLTWDDAATIKAIVNHADVGIPLPSADTEDLKARQQRITRAIALAPERWQLHRSLAATQLRQGQYIEALASITHAMKLRANAGEDPTTESCRDLAILAMTQWKLVRRDEARSTVAKLRELMKEPVWSLYPGEVADAKVLVVEAEALIDPPALPSRSTQP